MRLYPKVKTAMCKSVQCCEVSSLFNKQKAGGRDWSPYSLLKHPLIRDRQDTKAADTTGTFATGCEKGGQPFHRGRGGLAGV
jgi:hypothetical protein